MIDVAKPIADSALIPKKEDGTEGSRRGGMA